MKDVKSTSVYDLNQLIWQPLVPSSSKRSVLVTSDHILNTPHPNTLRRRKMIPLSALGSWPLAFVYTMIEDVYLL